MVYGGVVTVLSLPPGLEEALDCRGLPGKSGFNSKGLLMSAEKASRNDRICRSICGIGHELEQSSRMRM